MIHPRLLGTFVIALGLAAAPQSTEDPVMRARAQRAQAGGEQDLPPVPRVVLEPPPLPAPEIHIKDTRGYRASKKAKRGKRGKAALIGKGAAKDAKTPRAKKAVRVKK